MQSPFSCRAALIDISKNDAPILRQLQAGGESGSNGLCMRSDSDTSNDAMRFQLVVHKSDDRFGDGESQALTAAAGSVDERIDADQVSVAVNQRATAIAWIDRSIGLHVDHRTIDLRLSACRADNSLGHRVVQALRRADGDRRLSQTHLIKFG